MKTSQFKNLIKEAVKEAIHEELKDILLEAVKTSKTVVTEHKQIVNESNTPVKDPAKQRQLYMDIVNGMKKNQIITSETITQPLQITNSDTISEGSSLPAGEVSLDQIMKITSGGK